MATFVASEVQRQCHNCDYPGGGRKERRIVKNGRTIEDIGRRRIKICIGNSCGILEKVEQKQKNFHSVITDQFKAKKDTEAQ